MQPEQLKTPCFLVDQMEFEQNLADFQKILGKYFSNSILGYSFKTNSLPYIIELARRQGCYAETVSDTEYQLAVRMGFLPEQIIFNGPAKGKTQFCDAFCNKSIINIDSIRELEWLRELSEAGRIGSVGIRVNFDLESRLPGQTAMGAQGGRFGFCADNGSLANAIRVIRAMKGISVSGLHMHVSSKSKSVQIYEELAEKACEIAQRENLHLEYIDIGGGFFGGSDGGKAYDTYIRAVHAVLQKYGMEHIKLIAEPGASVVATAVDYMMTVTDVKETTYHRFIVTDGTRLHVDPFFHKTKYSYSLHAQSKNSCARQMICGYTCMENDRIMELENEPKLATGDKITYHVVGAYTMCFSSLFIEYLPAVYVKKDNDYKMVRQEWGVEEYIQKSSWEVSE